MAHDPMHTRICEEYGCEVPIVAFAHTKDVIAAVTNAGGIGVLGVNALTPEEIRSDIRWIRERVGNKPFGIDFLLSASYIEGSPEELESQIPQGHWDFIDGVMREHNIPEPKTLEPYGVARVDLLRKARAKFDVLIEENVPIFASGMGSPAFALEQLHSAGIKVWGLIGLARQAARELEQGLDLIVAQGQDSAGHTGRMGTFSLVPEVVELAKEYDTPVLAAGGITHGRHIAGALAFGADGVWTGTIWQATHESDTSMKKKQRLVEARGQDAWVSLAYDGKRVRALRSKFQEVWDQPDAPEPLAMPLQGMLVGKIEQAIDDHELDEWLHVTAGQGVTFIEELKPARQVVFDLAEQARDALEAIGAYGNK
jgi:NAD(P)H-dependent flavin oxidoreductase YrpB (nitropropane dioxygenase family)